MKICLAQLETVPSKDDNLRKIVSVVERLEEGTDLAVFPEYSMGYPREGLTRKYVAGESEKLDGGFVSAVATASRRKGAAVLLPVYERAGRAVYNTAVVIVKGRVLGGYRKIKLFDALGYRESDVFDTGSELVTFRLGRMRFGIVICYDLRFPELVKKLAMGGADAILVPSAWYRGPLKEEQWQTLLTARAHEDTCYVVGVGNANREFIGRSIVATPYGVRALDLGAGEKVGYFDLEPREVSEARRKLPVLSQSEEAPGCRELHLG
ncbi:MAG TPA: carbon-nitrogen hydrolase family protein [Conexivisphaerales archaeon]|nr:carbon-nitrogen hydrolase family protein [Conexivisphaerales archaeon]